MTRFFHRRGVSPVLSSVILSAMVLVIGASVWSVATGASSVITSNYFEDVMESVENIKERFCVDVIGVNKIDTEYQSLKIWILNYGTIEITVESISVKGGGVYTESFGTTIAKGDLVLFDVTPEGVSFNSGLSLTVEVRSNRGNRAYESILLP